jgi:uncharacterized membrane protein YkvI
MKNFLIIFGALIIVVGWITSKIAAKFNVFDTTPFSKYTFSKFCYEFEGVCNTLVVIGVTMVSIGLFI